MLLQKSARRAKDLKRSGNKTERYSAYTRTEPVDSDPEQHERLENDQLTDYSSSDESLDDPPSATPPTDRSPNKLATPKVTAISEEQKETLNKSDLTEYSMEDRDEDYDADYMLEASTLENY